MFNHPRAENKSLLYNLMFWLDVNNFNASGKRSGDRYLRLCQAWEIFNKYIGVGEKNEKVVHNKNQFNILFFLKL